MLCANLWCLENIFQQFHTNYLLKKHNFYRLKLSGFFISKLEEKHLIRWGGGGSISLKLMYFSCDLEINRASFVQNILFVNYLQPFILTHTSHKKFKQNVEAKKVYIRTEENQWRRRRYLIKNNIKTNFTSDKLSSWSYVAKSEKSIGYVVFVFPILGGRQVYAGQRGLKYTEHKPVGRHHLGVTRTTNEFCRGWTFNEIELSRRILAKPAQQIPLN